MSLSSAYGAHFATDGPLGSPLVAKFTQYDDMVSASFRSACWKGRVESPTLLNAYTISDPWVAHLQAESGGIRSKRQRYAAAFPVFFCSRAHVRICSPKTASPMYCMADDLACSSVE